MTSRHDESAAFEFTLHLGRALQAYGTPAHRLEDAMRTVVQTLGLEGEFFSTPTVLLASLGRQGERQTHILRIEHSDVDLEKMSKLAEIANDVTARRIDAQEGIRRIDQVLATPSPYSEWLALACFGIVSAAASRFFGAGPRELVLVLICGLIVGVLAIYSSRFAWIGRIFEPLSGFLVSFVATVGAALLGPLSVPIVTLAGLIVLVPGFTMTVAVNELAQRSLISGTARLHGALITFLMLGFGVALGGSIGAAIVGGVSTHQPTPLPPFTEWIAVAIAALTLGVLFRAPKRDLGWIVATCVLTFAAVSFSSKQFGPELGVFIGALTCGVLSNGYARLLERPAAITRVPSMMLLVPGGLGFLSISSLLEQDVQKGLQTAFSVGIMAVALVTGLLISNAIVPPGRKL